jgi:hypothetical protein
MSVPAKPPYDMQGVVEMYYQLISQLVKALQEITWSKSMVVMVQLFQHDVSAIISCNILVTILHITSWYFVD